MFSINNKIYKLTAQHNLVMLLFKWNLFCQAQPALVPGQEYFEWDMERKFVPKKSIPVITQPPHSPDLTLSDFWLFPTLKMGLKGTRFATVEDIKSNVTTELRKIPKEAFCQCFQQWQDRWNVCVCVCTRKVLH